MSAGLEKAKASVAAEEGKLKKLLKAISNTIFLNIFIKLHSIFSN